MEQKNLIEIKRDELGIIPVDMREQITLEIKNLILNTELQNPENKKRFDTVVINNKDLVDSLSKTAFYTLVRRVANECGEFNTSEYLIDKYELDSISVDVDGDFYSLARKTVEEYIEQDKLVSKYEDYMTSLEEEIDTLSEKEDDIEDENQLKKYETRISSLGESVSEIDDFITDPYNYSDRVIDKYIDKLEYYILDNADLYVNTNELFDKLVNDIQIDSPEAEMLYLNTIKEYAKKYKEVNKQNSVEETNEEILGSGKRVK